MRIAAAIVGLEAVLTVEDDDYDNVISSYYELLILSEDVEAGSVNSVAVLNAAFIRTHRALAKAKYNKTMEYWDLNGRYRVGRNLRATLRNMEQWAAWSGHEFSSDVRMRITNARQTANNMIMGEEFSTGNVTLALEMTKKQIAILDLNLGAARKKAEIDRRKRQDEASRAKRSAKRNK